MQNVFRASGTVSRSSGSNSNAATAASNDLPVGRNSVENTSVSSSKDLHAADHLKKVGTNKNQGENQIRFRGLNRNEEAKKIARINFNIRRDL